MYKDLQERYSTVNILESVKDWAFNKLDKPLELNSKPRSQINTWVGKALQWGKNVKNKDHASGPMNSSPVSLLQKIYEKELRDEQSRNSQNIVNNQDGIS